MTALDPPGAPAPLPPPAPPPGGESRKMSDAEQVNVLAICYLVFGAVTGLFALACLAYVAAGAAMALAGATAPKPSDQIALSAFGGCFASLGGFLAAIIGISAAMKIFVGIALRQHRWRTACMVIACIVCLNIPLGTLLGIFTLLVLSRPSVASLFGEPPATALFVRSVP